MGRRRKKGTPLTGALGYWTRTTRRIIILLIGIFILILVLIALFWIIPILIDTIMNAFA